MQSRNISNTTSNNSNTAKFSSNNSNPNNSSRSKGSEHKPRKALRWAVLTAGLGNTFKSPLFVSLLLVIVG